MMSTNRNSAVEQEIIEMEKQWNAAIKAQDTTAMDHFLADSYFLAIGVQGMPLQVVPRAAWLTALEFYVTESFSIDDMQVHVYGDTAVMLMLFTQKATVRGSDRSGQFAITDIWVRGAEGWRVAERHSNRPEPAALIRPQATT